MLDNSLCDRIAPYFSTESLGCKIWRFLSVLISSISQIETVESEPPDISLSYQVSAYNDGVLYFDVQSSIELVDGDAVHTSWMCCSTTTGRRFDFVIARVATIKDDPSRCMQALQKPQALKVPDITITREACSPF